MIELIKVEQFDGEKFNVLVSVDGEDQSYVIEAKETTVGDGNEIIWYILAEDDNFYDIWGQSFEFRKVVSSLIQTFKAKSKPELQTA